MEIAGARSITRFQHPFLSIPPSCFLVISLQLSAKEHLRKRTEICSKWSPEYYLLLLLFYNEETGGKVLWDAHELIPECSKLWCPMGIQPHMGTGRRFSALQVTSWKCLSPLWAALHLSCVGELNHHSQPPSQFGKVSINRRRDKPTQTQRGKAYCMEEQGKKLLPLLFTHVAANSPGKTMCWSTSTCLGSSKVGSASCN